jgi:hypothetical protein
MAGRYAVGSIAGVALQDAGGRNARIDVLDGEQLTITAASASVLAIDFTVHTQVAVNSKKGIHFGVHVALLSIAKYQAIIAAIQTALLASSTFNVTLADSGTDKTDNINLNCVPDFAANNGKVANRGALTNVYLKDVVFRFIVT